MTYYKQDLIWNKRSKSKTQTSPVDRDEDRAWGWFSKYIRTRDCLRTTGRKDIFKCCSCWSLTLLKNGDAGHFISRSYTTTKFDERNVYAQCMKCNRFQQWCWDKMYEHIEKLHGKTVIDELMAKKNEIAKYIDYSKLSDQFRELFNTLK
jgi:5-methylcytosine-specific restriction endonuclease McrA